jgi:hypothetical protein
MYSQFKDAIGEHSLYKALLLVTQAFSDATEEMTTIVTSSQPQAATVTHPHSQLIAHITTRRKVLATELKAFLTELAQRITAAGKVDSIKGTGVNPTRQATAVYIDFLDCLLSKADNTLVLPESLSQTETATAATPAPAIVTLPGAHWQGQASKGGTGGAAAYKAARTNNFFPDRPGQDPLPNMLNGCRT